MNEFDIGEIVSSTDSCFDKEEVIREVFDAAGDSKIRLTTSMNEALITIDCGTNTNPVPTK